MSRLLDHLEQCNALWALSLPSWLSFKIPYFKDLVWQGSALVFWGRVISAGTDAGLTQKNSHTRAQKQGIHTKEPVSRLAALSRCLCTYAEGQGRKWHLLAP